MCKVGLRSILTCLLLPISFVASQTPTLAWHGSAEVGFQAYLNQIVVDEAPLPKDAEEAVPAFVLSDMDEFEKLWNRTVKERREFGLAVFENVEPYAVERLGRFDWKFAEGSGWSIKYPEEEFWQVRVGEFHTHPTGDPFGMADRDPTRKGELDLFSFRDIRNFAANDNGVFSLLRSSAGYSLLIKTKAARLLSPAPYEISVHRAMDREEDLLPIETAYLLRYAQDSGLVYYRGDGLRLAKVERATLDLPSTFIDAAGRGPENELTWRERVLLQAVLKYRGGMATLIVDGKFGPATRAAIQEFQATEGRAATGFLADEDFFSLYEPVRDGAWAGLSRDPGKGPGVVVGAGMAFEGQLDEEGEFAGQGRLITADGHITEGHFRDGYLEGQGVRRVEDREDVGQFVQGKLSSGVRSFASGERHEGTFNAEGRISEGVIQYSDGATAQGHFNDRLQLIGEGEYVNKDGASQTGMFHDNQLHGHGSKKTHEYTYEGEFRNGKLDGQGTMRWPKGITIEGLWRDGWLLRGKLTNQDGQFEVTQKGEGLEVLRRLD